MTDNIEARDYIAREDDWEYGEFTHRMDKRVGWYKLKFTPYGEEIRPCWCDHPIPNTLDEAAQLPEGWTLQNIGFHIHGVAEPFVSAFATKGDWRLTMVDGVEVPGTRMRCDAPTELEARFALRVAVLKQIASKEQSK